MLVIHIISSQDTKDFSDIYDGLNAIVLVNPSKSKCKQAPTISQVFKWLREEKKIYIVNAYMPKIVHETSVSNDFYYPTFQKIGLFEPMFFIGGDDNSDTYEEAALAGIKYVLDNVI